MIQKANPIINIYERKAALADESYLIDGRTESMFAFAIGDYTTGQALKDPKYIKWFAQVVKFEREEWTYKGVHLHPCTDQELDSFYLPDDQSAERVQYFRE